MPEGASPYQWNTVLPINVGALYQIDMNAIQPYLGADFIVIPGYVREGASTATGARIRTGMDIPIASNFSFNVNLSLGFWSGEEFKQVQANLEESGAVPQFSAGTAFLF